ncbi:MAG: hypothetical protein COB96_05195 [Planctomycetota bacterium]|nr:MAG: hypothetical protein COB96_05195 [Planctomycetota bacterium]
MASSLRRFFLHDMGRKLLALLLACAVWWIANKQITVQTQATLVIVEVNTSGQPDPGTLAIRPPNGWQLAQPTAGSETQFWYKGPRNRLEQFMESEPAAFFDAGAVFTDPGKNQHSTTIEVDATDLRWRRQDDARLLLSAMGAIQHKLQLRFDRRHSAEIMLHPELIKVVGNPAPGYRCLGSHLQLSTNAITISGPFGRIDELERQLEMWANGDGGTPVFLVTLKVDGARTDLKRLLGLRTGLLNSGLSMHPEQIEVILPVILDNRTPIEFSPPEPQRMGTPIAGIWDAQFTAQAWVAELADHPELRDVEFNTAWVNRHLRLFLPMAEIPEDANEYDLPVQWMLTGIDNPDKRDLLLRNLNVIPIASENAKVRMTKRIEQP